MALADEEDPVEAIKDLLTGTVDGDWLNAVSKPSVIERMEESERKIKENRSGDAVYIQSRLESDLNKIDPAGDEVDEVALVTVQCWSKTSAEQAENLLRDVIAIVADKANDSNETTSWVDWWPDSSEDFTAQTNPKQADHFIKAVQVRLRDLRST